MQSHLWGSTSGGLRTPEEARDEFLKSAGSDSCHGGAQRVSNAHFGRNGKGRASDEYRFITSPPIGVLFYYCGRLKLSYGPVLHVLPVLLVLLWSSQAV
jgi:hypothetical protein